MKSSRLQQLGFASLAVLLGVLLPGSALADEQGSHSFPRQLLLLWLPLLAIVSLWAWFIRKSLLKGRGSFFQRWDGHADRLEEKLDRVIELLERRERQ